MVDVVGSVELIRKAAGADPVLGSDHELCERAVGLEQARAAINATSLRVLAELDSRKVTDTTTGLSTGTWAGPAGPRFHGRVEAAGGGRPQGP